MILVDTPSAILDAVASVGYAAYAYAKICFKCGFNSKPLEGCEDDVDAKEQDEGT